MLITTAIDATEGRGVAVIETLGSLLTSNMDKEVIVILENDMVDTMFEIDRKIYGKYVIYGEN